MTNMKTKMPIPLLAVAFAAIATAALAQGDSVSAPSNRTYTDSEIERMVQHDLEGLGLAETHVNVIAGEVTLTGIAPSLGSKRKADERVLKVREVQSVDDQMKVVPTSDAEIRTDLKEKLDRYVHYTIYDHVETSVASGVVVLSGEVTMPYKAGEIEAALADVPGVQEIDNHIRVLPASAADDSLRIAVGVEIYRLLPQYALRPNPPIHVLVENGRVTLFGTVADQAEDRLVERETRRTPGVLSVEDRLRVANGT